MHGYAGEFAPKLLPCFHSVCASCARDLAKYKGPGRRCPMCREDVGYEELVDNFVVLDMLDEHQLTSGRERACSNECIGDDANATHYCELCSKFLCQLCVSMHSRQRATVGHTLVTMQELQSDAGRGVLGRRSSLRLDTTEFCVKHPDHKLDLFCVSCNMIVCSKCALLEHPPPMHTLEGVDEIMAATASEIQTLASKCDLVERRLDASRCGDVHVRQHCRAYIPTHKHTHTHTHTHTHSGAPYTIGGSSFTQMPMKHVLISRDASLRLWSLFGEEVRKQWRPCYKRKRAGTRSGKARYVVLNVCVCMCVYVCVCVCVCVKCLI
jgi:hypothetical protein